MYFRALLLVGVGGALGSMARYAVSVAMAKVATVSFPVSTFGINVVGSFLIGLIVGFYIKGSHGLSQNMVLLLATGFCGGFTTFSAFALENINLLQKGQSLMAILYASASVVCGLLLCRLGLWLTS
jgi:fluoride exporter